MVWIICVGVFFVIILMLSQIIKDGFKKELKQCKKGEAHGIIFGKKGKNLIFSPEDAEGHVGVFSASGTGKTSAVGIPTLRSWKGTSFTIDISGDILRNCPDMPNKLIYRPEATDTTPYNVFGCIDELDNQEEKNEALARLALLLMPERPNMNDNARFFLKNGRDILTASLIAFYGCGLDFVDIAKKIVGNSYQTLFFEIDKTENKQARLYINSFEGASEQNTAGCKQTCDEALKLFATNGKVKKTLRRPAGEETAIEPKKIESNNLFVVVEESNLELYSPLMNIITSQIMEYIARRTPKQNSPTILLFLDEFGSLRLDAELVLAGVRRFRKRKCRIMMLMQNTVDMDILYGRDAGRAILSNLRFKALLGGLGEPESQKYFAELIGRKEVKKHSVSKNSKSTTHTESDVKEWIIEPADLDRQGKDSLIVIASDEPNGYIKLRKNYYFNQKEKEKQR